MKFLRNDTGVYVPERALDISKITDAKALSRVTHLGIGAHQDDLEIMAFHGINECFQQPDRWFGATIVTNGKGSPRDGVYERYSDGEMIDVRCIEQKKAATVGEYSIAILLMHPSDDVKYAPAANAVGDLRKLIDKAEPTVVYTHNLADKHPTHVAVAVRTIQALRELGTGDSVKVYGCEVWRDLDWMPDKAPEGGPAYLGKVALDVTGVDNLEAALLGVHDSQVRGGKRYDRASMGRRIANTTYADTHAVQGNVDSLIYAMDLTPLVAKPDLDMAGYVSRVIDQFHNEVESGIAAAFQPKPA
jgi:LmbE family N-acetylglucosaminyl deacetylase